MSEYPEHEKLAAINDQSQAIGEFLDNGLPQQNMAIYEYVRYDCECSYCGEGRGHRSPYHSAMEKEGARETENGGTVIQIESWQPTHKSIQTILATYFAIDLKKIDDEKAAMLAALRAANA